MYDIKGRFYLAVTSLLVSTVVYTEMSPTSSMFIHLFSIVAFLNHLFPVLGNTIVKPFFTLAMFYGTIPLFSLIMCTCDTMCAYWHPMIGDNVVGPLRQCMLMYTITMKFN